MSEFYNNPYSFGFVFYVLLFDFLHWLKCISERVALIIIILKKYLKLLLQSTISVRYLLSSRITFLIVFPLILRYEAQQFSHENGFLPSRMTFCCRKTCPRSRAATRTHVTYIFDGNFVQQTRFELNLDFIICMNCFSDLLWRSQLFVCVCVCVSERSLCSCCTSSAHYTPTTVAPAERVIRNSNPTTTTFGVNKLSPVLGSRLGDVSLAHRQSTLTHRKCLKRSRQYEKKQWR